MKENVFGRKKNTLKKKPSPVISSLIVQFFFCLFHPPFCERYTLICMGLPLEALYWKVINSVVLCDVQGDKAEVTHKRSLKNLEK